MALNAVCNERLESREKLIVNLFRTVEHLVDVGVSKQSLFFFWSGLNHLHFRVKCILRHGAKIRHHLIFGQPSFASFDTWLESKLADHSLVTELTGSYEDIKEFYYEWAFLFDQKLFQIFVDSLRVLATRDLDLLTEIMSSDLKTYCNLPVIHVQEIGHSQDEVDTERLDIPSDSKESISSTSSEPVTFRSPNKSAKLEAQIYADDTDDASSNLSIPTFSYTLVSPVSSPPEFSHMTAGFIRPNSNRNSSGSSSSVFQEDASSPQIVVDRVPSTSSPIQPVFTGTPADKTKERRSSRSPFPDENFTSESKKTPVSFLESGGLIQPPALGHFPLPQKGQSLTSFLSSLSDTLPELDRENAHFNVSEALISAFERLKVNRLASKKTDKVDGLDEMEDMFGTVKAIAQSAQGDHQRKPVDELTIPKPSSTRKFYSGKAFPRPPIVHTETEESEFEYWKQQPRRPPAHLKKRPRGGKLGSDGRSEGRFSTTEVSTSISSALSSDEDIASSSFSAENVALNLLRNAKMKDENLPPACELQWLVSENEAPQNLLPMPKNWATSASESESDFSGKTDTVGKLDKSMRLRGTCDWAPPRPQIIFTIHPPPSLSILTDTQRYRCAGCGMRVDPKYASTFRYCFYLGRYFCTGCHTGKKTRLPQMILHKWDFSPYMVSNFSATLLESLQSDPVYNVLAINPNLTRKVKLNNFRNYRIQLGFLHEYLKNCKVADPLYQEFKKLRTYYTSDVDLCSLEDLINVRFSTGMPLYLKDFVSHSIHHVMHCGLCKNLGFVCEICKRNEILFPFQIHRVSRCPQCASCFHLKCFNPNMSDCPKCLRLTKRRNTVEISTASIAV